MIELNKDGGVWRVALNRPEKANSLTAEMLENLIAVVGDARNHARALILTGEGKVFSAGADLDEARSGLAVSPLWEDLSSGIAELDCLTIAALNGTLAGGAFGMALACDLRVSVAKANFFYPVMKLGFLPQPSDPPRLRALVGPSRAKMILMAGQKIGADTALDWGLVDRLCEPDALSSVCDELARPCAEAEPGHCAAIKAMI